LFEDEIVMLASVKHRLAGKKSLKVADMTDISIAMPSERISAAQALGKFFEDHGIDRRQIEMSCDDGHALIEIIKKGKYDTFLPRFAVKDNDPEICELTLPPPGIHFKAGALWTHLSPSSKAFLEIASKEAEKLAIKA
jgi:DNA-binding transcriptional LysR family regulator